jgi:hypothetical protein
MVKIIHSGEGDKIVIACDVTDCTVENFTKLYNRYSALDVVNLLYASGYSITIESGHLAIVHNDEKTACIVWSALRLLPDSVVKSQLLIQLIEANNA